MSRIIAIIMFIRQLSQNILGLVLPLFYATQRRKIEYRGKVVRITTLSPAASPWADTETGALWARIRLLLTAIDNSYILVDYNREDPDKDRSRMKLRVCLKILILFL